MVDLLINIPRPYNIGLVPHYLEAHIVVKQSAFILGQNIKFVLL